MPVTSAAGRRVMARLDELAIFSERPDMLTRLFLSPEHRRAADQVQTWMREAGMRAALDPAGNVAGRYEGHTEGLPALLLGSHIDTVRNAGKYDGNLGVVAAIEAVAALHHDGVHLPFAIEVIGFGDEEGVRFPVTLTGSKAVAGTFDPAALDAVDADGITMRDALIRFGCDPAAIAGVARPRDKVLGYFEVHIEQGPVLEAENLPVGVVTAINGASRVTVAVTGQAGHAGTVPMDLRRDALCAAAEMIIEAEHVGRETKELVVTVGKLNVEPGATNVIPSGTNFTLDIRSPSDLVRRDAIARMSDRFSEVASRRRVGLTITPTYAERAMTCDPAFMMLASEAVARAGYRRLLLPSGAGHDGLAIAALCPIGMLFVRCAGGISHNPAEAITAADASVAVDVLIDFLRHFDPEVH
ncbi:MAG: allantoate amidohydrolase [Acetobacteraceae bacterium]|nr:allantoate amidohydrolase [Acetobacteraceae bacterium]